MIERLTVAIQHRIEKDGKEHIFILGVFDETISTNRILREIRHLEKDGVTNLVIVYKNELINQQVFDLGIVGQPVLGSLKVKAEEGERKSLGEKEKT